MSPRKMHDLAFVFQVIHKSSLATQWALEQDQQEDLEDDPQPYLLAASLAIWLEKHSTPQLELAHLLSLFEQELLCSNPAAFALVTIGFVESLNVMPDSKMHAHLPERLKKIHAIQWETGGWTPARDDFLADMESPAAQRPFVGVAETSGHGLEES